MDSLMAVELRLALESRLRIDLPLVSLVEGTSIASIATRLAAGVSAPMRPEEGEIVALAERHLPATERVAQEEVQAWLRNDEGPDIKPEAAE
jgi:hypothetical protein